MAKYAQYNKQARTNIVSSSSPAAKEAMGKANFDQSMSDLLLSAANKVGDAYATEKGKKAAINQGMDWKPVSQFTEAGRAYDNAGATIARNMTSIQMSSAFDNIFAQQSNKPLSVGENGSVAMLGKTIDSFTESTAKGKSTDEQVWIKENAARSKAMLMPKMARQVGIQQRAFAKTAALDSYESAKNTYTNSLHDYHLMPIGHNEGSAASKAAIEANNAAAITVGTYKHDAEMALLNLSSQSYLTPEQVVTSEYHLKYDAADAAISGRMNNSIDDYNLSLQTPGSNPLLKIAQIKAFPAKYLKSSVDDNLPLDDKRKIANKLQGQANSFVKQTEASYSKLMLQSSNAADMGFYGQKDNIIQTGQALADFAPEKLPKFLIDSRGGELGRSMVDKASGTQGLLVLKQNLFNPEYGQSDTHPIDPQVLASAHQTANKQIDHILAETKDDPAGSFVKQQAYVDYVSNRGKHVTGSSNQQRESNQLLFNNQQNDKTLLLTQNMPDRVKQAVNDCDSHLYDLQHNDGLNPQMTTKVQLQAMVHLLNSVDKGVGLAMLNKLKTNEPTNYSTWQSNLLNAGMDKSLIFYSNQGVDTVGGKADREIAMTDKFDDPTYFKDVLAQKTRKGTGTEQSIIKGLSENTKLMNQFSDLQQSYDSPYSDTHNSATYMSSLKSVMSRILLSYSMKDNTDYDTAVKTHGTQVMDDLLGDKYQNLKYRMPKTVATQTNPVGVPLKQSNALSMMKLVKSKALREVDEGHYTAPDMSKEDKATKMGLLRMSIQSGDFVPNASGNGVVLIDSQNRPVIGKNGKAMGFSWEQAMQHSAPIMDTDLWGGVRYIEGKDKL